MEKVVIILGDISKGAGTERAVTNLANMLNSALYSVTICSLYSKTEHYFELNENIYIVHLNISQRRKGAYLKVVYLLRKFLKKESPSFVIGTTHAINSLLPLSTIALDVKLIGCEHMSYKAAPKFSSILRRIAYPYLSAVVVLTYADSLFYTFVKNKIYVIPNSISFIPTSYSLLDLKTIISVGRLTEQKGYDYLLEIILLIRDRLNGWKFKIFGDGELKEDLLTEIEKLGLSSCINIYPPTKNIYDEYINSSLYVMTSRWEGLPMVLIEASSCGLPLISFDCPEGPRDVIQDGINGYLIPILDKHQFGDRIIELCENLEKRKLLGYNSMEVSKKFSSDKVLIKWKSLFQTIK